MTLIGPKTECTILIVEDDPDIRDALRDVLELDGYEIVEASNGKEGLERLRNIVRPCVILLDLMMPVMSGREFIAVLRETDVLATIPVVVVSAWPDEAAHVRERTQGFVRKPVMLDALLSLVERFCTAPPPRGAVLRSLELVPNARNEQ
ncbi:MAG TPA: response regulator [Labilithrix sp.]|nr:response regulator [Labilithrix sp.]